MNELITVKNENGELLVSARDLHEGLEIGKDFSTWIKNMFKYGFEESVDYIVFTEIGEKGGRPRKEYILKLDCAKEIAMIQRSEKGKQIRKYFIECEKKLKEVLTPSYMIEDEIARAQAWIKEQEEKRKLKEELQLQAPKVEVYDMFIDKDTTYGFRELRKSLESALNISIKETELKRVMRDLGWISGNSVKRLLAKCIREGYGVTKDTFDIFENPITVDRFTMKAREELLKYF